MGHMKDIDIRIRSGGDEAIAAAYELAGLADERRGYEDTMNAPGDITDIVTVLRGVGFSTVSPQAGDSASLLHYCVTHAANEIEYLRDERRWIPVSERLPENGQQVLACIRLPHWNCEMPSLLLTLEYSAGSFLDESEGRASNVTHWMPLPEPPAV